MFNLPITRVPTTLTALCIAAGLSLSAAPAFAASVAVYKVTDADGRVTYQNFAPESGAGRVEKKTFDPEANAMNFTRPRAVGTAPSGGGNIDNNAIAARVIDNLLRRSGNEGTSISVSRGPGFSVLGGGLNRLNHSDVAGGEASGIVTPSGNFIGSDNVTLGNANAGGGTGTGGGQGSGPTIVNPSTGSATFSGGSAVFTGNSPTFTSNSPTFTSNSPTFTSNSATFSSNTGTLGPATPGVGAGTIGGATNSFNNTGGGANTGTIGTTQTGVAPGTNPFAGTPSAAPRGGRPAAR